jgi:hypothetical protein
MNLGSGQEGCNLSLFLAPCPFIFSAPEKKSKSVYFLRYRLAMDKRNSRIDKGRVENSLKIIFWGIFYFFFVRKKIVRGKLLHCKDEPVDIKT